MNYLYLIAMLCSNTWFTSWCEFTLNKCVLEYQVAGVENTNESNIMSLSMCINGTHPYKYSGIKK